MLQLTAIASALSVATAWAVEGEGGARIIAGPAAQAAPLILSTDPGASRFIPVGKLLTGNGSYNCTATLIAGADTPAADRRALILTAGHCAGETDDNTVIIDQPAGSGWTFTPSYFIDTQPQHVSFPVQRVLYATMKDVDLAVLELGVTYGELRARGINALKLLPADTSVGMPIELAHVPVIDVDEHERYLRHSLCTTRPAQFIFEGFHPWYWSSALPNDCQGIAGGTSGSPVFARGGNTVMAVLNTTVTADMQGCGLGRPCELDAAGLPQVREGSSYAIAVDRIAAALRNDSTLDLAQLDPGNGIVVSRTSAAWITQAEETVAGQRVPARWNLLIQPGFERVRYKTGMAGVLDCADADGYSAPLPAAEQPLLDLQVPAQEGVHAACLVGGRSDGSWQAFADATMRLRQIDVTPPVVQPGLQERVGPDGALDILPTYAIYEISSIFVKYGLAQDIDCSSGEGYQRYFTDRWIRVQNQAGTWRFCAYGTDQAGNSGLPMMRDFPAQR